LWYLKLNNANSAVKRGYCLDWPFLEDAEMYFREDNGAGFKETTNYLFMQPRLPN